MKTFKETLNMLKRQLIQLTKSPLKLTLFLLWIAFLVFKIAFDFGRAFALNH